MSANGPHPSPLAWARRLSGESGWLERRRFRRHLVACDACRRLEAEAEADRAVFDASPERREELALLKARTRGADGRDRAPLRRTRSRWGGVAAAAAVVAAIAIRAPREEPGLAAKGGDGLTLYVERPAGATLLDSRCATGDRVIARYRTERPYLLLLERDGRGVVQVLFPQGGATSARLPSSEGATPTSWVLDATPGRECFAAFFSDDPLPISSAAHALEGAEPPTAPPGASLRIQCCEKATSR